MKKITLNKETVRRLDATDLRRANGGIHPTCAIYGTAPPKTYTCYQTLLGCDTEVDCITIRPCAPLTRGQC